MGEAEITKKVVQAANELTPEENKPKATKKTPKAKKAKPATPFQVGESGFLTKAQRAQVILVTDENDLLYNPKVKDPPPEHLHKALADPKVGWLETNPLTILPDGRIWSGRTKWRVLEKAERERGAEVPVPFKVIEINEEQAADATDMLDMQVQKLNPMLIAEKIFRSYSRGKTEKEILETTGIAVNDQHGYLLLLDEDKCPESVQELLREGRISFAAALELARKAESMTKAELTQAAEQIVKVASGGLKVTAAQVKRASGVTGDGPATQKAKKQLILDLQSGELGGKMGEAAKWAAIVAMEVGLGTRTVDSFWSAIDKIARGNTIRIDFKQYQVDGKAETTKAPEKPVKGQGKKVKGKK